MPVKVVIVGAGSAFGGRTCVDMLASDILRDATVCLTDIHPGRLQKVTEYVQRTIDYHNMPMKIISDTDRTKVLPGADFVITSIAASGGAYYGFPYDHEIGIPRKYGIEQSIGDTCSVGSVFRFLRTGPAHHRIVKDIERLCPEAYVLNHTNPMAPLTWLHLIDSKVRFIGLCHSVQGTTKLLASFLNVPFEEVSFQVAGINHQAWVLQLKRGDEDLLPRLKEVAKDPEIRKQELTRFEIMDHFGYFPTESSPHNSEYLPYFRRTPELMAQYGLEKRIVPEKRTRIPQWLKELGEGDDAPIGKIQRSVEYTIGIMEGILTNKPYKFNGNVLNTGLITNLPDKCCVEVPCFADASGVHPCYVGALPPQLAAINRLQIAQHELVVQAVLNHDREAAYHAVALDPNVSAMLSLPQIRKMFNELWEAEKDLLHYFDSPDAEAQEICAED